MKFLSLDASTTCIGWSIWEDRSLLKYGKIKPTEKNLEWRSRIVNLMGQLDKIIKEYKPSKIYCEDVPLMSKGGKITLVMLGVTQGSIIGLCSSNNIPICFKNVGTWRHDIGLFDGSKDGKERDNLKINSIKLANEIFNLDLKCEFTKSGKYDGNKSDDDISDSILLYASTISKYCNRDGKLRKGRG